MRYIQLDGLRGLLLISMVVGHLGSGLSLGATHNLVYKVGLINDAASAFVFLSGLTVGLAYTKGWLDPLFAQRKRALRSRTVLIFSHHLFLVLVTALAATVALEVDWYHWILAPYGSAPILFGILSSAMLTAGWFLDILPMYVLFMLLTPLALAAITSGRRWIVIALVITAWILGQTGLLEAFWGALAGTFGFEQHHIALGLDFNRLAWSALYFTGLLLGSAYVRGELNLSTLRDPRSALVMLACVVLIAATMLLFALYHRGIVTDHVALFAALISKSRLGLLALLNFLALAFVTTWLVVAGPTSPYASMRFLGRQLNRLLCAPPLVLLGQHSLTVFTFHVVGVYLFYLSVDASRIEPWGANAILLVGVASLAIPALVERHIKSRRQSLPMAAGAGQNP